VERILSDSILRERFGSAGPASLSARGMSAEEMIRGHRDLYRLISLSLP
jgi:hypothetical protein